MVPQMGLMHPLILQDEIPYSGVFAIKLGLGGSVGILLGHFSRIGQEVDLRESGA
jgi:hypothetical protein